MRTTTMADRRFRHGFRIRVLGFSGALLVVATLVGLVVQRAVLIRQVDDEAIAALVLEREELEQLAGGRNPATGAPFGADARAILETFLQRNVPAPGQVYLTILDGQPHLTTPPPDGVRLDLEPGLVERWAALTDTEQGTLDTAAGPAHYLVVPILSGGEQAGALVAASFVDEQRQEIDDAIRVEAAVSMGVIVVALAVAWVTAGRLLRPVRQVTETARAISESDLSRRIPVDGDDEIAELAATFNAMLDRLEGAFVAQRTFIDDAGHELRTPITVVRGHLELMGDSPRDRQETVSIVTDELDRMSRIVDDLLVLAKAEQPDFVRLGPVSLPDLTDDLFAKARALGDRDWRLDALADGTAALDAQRLTQAVLNLARNAVEHTNEGTEIGLGSAISGDEVRFWVRDTGAGVDERDQERIFERFARGRSGRRRSDGAGLGLAITTAIARAHGGRVELDSIPGVGATFSLVLPAAARPAVVDLTEPSTTPPTPPTEPTWSQM
jgi:two-component system OmpR family sensor kinase